MQKVTVTFKSLDLAKTIEQKKEVYTTATEMTVTASTKSTNNLLEGYRKEGKLPQTTKVDEIFIDQKKVEAAILEVVKKDFQDEKVAKAITALCVSGIDKVCAFKRPEKK